jgi:hypothetical protein
VVLLLLLPTPQLKSLQDRQHAIIIISVLAHFGFIVIFPFSIQPYE